MGAGGTTLTDSRAIFHADMIGSLCYMTSGANAGLGREVASLTSTVLTFAAPFPYEIETGDRYCINGVPFKIRCWSLQDKGVSKFNRWNMVGATLKCRGVSGFNGSSGEGTYPVLQVADGTFKVRTADPGLTQGTAVSNLTDLQNMSNDLTANYYLTGDIDASASAALDGGKGFAPIGSDPGIGDETEFAGTFDGNGYTISNLTIDRPAEDKVGLFGFVNAWNGTDVVIANVTLEDCNFIGENASIGGIIGLAATESGGDEIHLHNCHVSGAITAEGTAGTSSGIGGVIGTIADSNTTIYYDCTSSCNIDMSGGAGSENYYEIGGFVGSINSDGAEFYNCRASGTITGRASDDSVIGGFVGTATTSIFQDCSATGNVNGDAFIGGFCGIAVSATFTRCSARGNAVADNGSVGGFVGNTYGASNSWTDCYAWGDVTETDDSNAAGGFIGDTNADTTFTRCYGKGLVTGYDYDDSPTWYAAGGFIGWDFGGSSTYTTCFWDSETTGVPTDGQNGGGVEHTTEWMQTKANYVDAGWDFDTVWYLPGPGPESDVNDNSFWRVSAYRGVDKELSQVESYIYIPVDRNPATSAGALNVAGIDLEPYIEQIAAGVVFELTDAEFNVSWTDSRKVGG